jgi:hypothetical protein
MSCRHDAVHCEHHLFVYETAEMNEDWPS